MSSFKTYGKARLAVIIAATAALALGAALWHSTGAIGQEQGAKKEVNQKSVEHANELSKAFRKAAEIAMPSVVTVTSKTKSHEMKRGVKSRRGDNPLKGTPFEDMFPDFGDDFGGGGMQGFSPRREGMGSGVIIDKSGIVLTNNHVVEGADEVTVRLPDGREFKGGDIKTDEQTDLAVIHIKGAGSLPAATLGDSDQMEIGDWVLAIGNPFALEQTVSAGIISGKGRELDRASDRQLRAKFLQTDAAINPGNSGGPLVNLDGEVIGINTAIATSSGGYQGIGFAIPTNTAKWVINQLIKRGSVERAYLGVSIQPVDKNLADRFGVKRGEGVAVSEVFPKSPAAEAGFKEGDIIVRFDDHPVHNPRELTELVERAPVDSKQKVEVLRDGRTETLEVTAKPLPKDFGVASHSSRPRHEESDSSAYENEKLGLEVTDLLEEQADALGFGQLSGALVSKVDRDGIAAEHGLRQGDLILMVGKRHVKNAEEFKEAVSKESLKDGILLLVRTHSGNRSGNRLVVLREE